MLHQRIGVLKILRMKESGFKTALLGHIQRSGKTYTIAGCIIADSENKEKCNYFIITTAPNETFDSFTDINYSLSILTAGSGGSGVAGDIVSLTDKEDCFFSKNGTP